MEYRFDQIAINSTTKKKPVDADKEHYIGLEHLDSDCLEITRWGADAAPVGEKLLMQRGDILFGKRRAYQRKVGIAPFDGIFSAHGMVLRPKKDVVTKEFFPFFIASDQFMERAVRISVGGLSPTINWKDLKEQVFDLPSLSEQKILADKLWAAYRLKESYKRLLTATDEMVKSQFIEMFGDQNLNDKGWVSSPIKDEFTLNMGKTPARAESSYWTDNGNKWISIADMANYSKFTGETAEQITDKAIKECGIKPVEPNTVIMSFKLSIGRTAITSEKVYTNEAIMAFSNYDPNKFALEFVYYAFSQKNWLMGAKQAVKGATLNKESIGKSSIIIPPLNLQEEFVAILKQADKSKFELRKSIEAIDAVIKSLINN